MERILFLPCKEGYENSLLKHDFVKYSSEMAIDTTGSICRNSYKEKNKVEGASSLFTKSISYHPPTPPLIACSNRFLGLLSWREMCPH
ncbi:hypothetical protein CEXT_126941 [Caerostris extrusa]|uniref:Uncharacterized protein n=1 Tax=Caerostris extrusa TaxID=172846 RepID=A0AAV4VRH8_CAEEX|nr:hypothetical protein CEXT_126941 [Caerostris extrusa]